MRKDSTGQGENSLHPSPGTRETGQIGERLAADYLTNQGCVILARNWRANPGEIDIVARCPLEGMRGVDDGSGLLLDHERDILAFVEVRTRHGEVGRAEESVSRRKAAGMVSAALQYIAAHNLDPDDTPWRIDVVAVAISGDRLASINWAQGAIGEEALE
jgi:putative endonuclease